MGIPSLVRKVFLVDLLKGLKVTFKYQNPKEIYTGKWASPMGWFFTFIIPVLLIVNVPSEAMVKVLDPWLVTLMVIATVVLLLASRWFFRYALRRYRSASS